MQCTASSCANPGGWICRQYHTFNHPCDNAHHTQPHTLDDPMRHDIMDYEVSDNNHNLITPPRSLPHQRREKRKAELQLEEIQRSDEPQQQATRRVAGMFTTIPNSIWAFTTNAVSGFFGLFRPQQNPAQPQTHPNPHLTPRSVHIEGVATDHTGRKRRAVDATSTPYQPRFSESSSPNMIVTRPPAAVQAPPDENAAKKVMSRRERYHDAYFNPRKNVDLIAAKIKAKAQQPPAPEKYISLKERNIAELIEQARLARGGSWAQKACLHTIAEKEAAARAATEYAVAEAARLEGEARTRAAEEEARVRAEAEEARAQAEEEAARAREIIAELPEYVIGEIHDRLSATPGERDTVVQLGPIPVQKITLIRILTDNESRDSWLDDDAVNSWYNAIVDAKKRQAGYVKNDANPPPFANLQTAWWSKVMRDGPAGLTRWLKRAGVDGVKLLKCERLFLPINHGSHWTLLIINGVDQSIEYLDSLGGDGGRFFQIARELIKSELGDKYNAQKWQDLKRNRSSKQDNMNDCGVFTCFNGLAAAKDKPYREVTATKMPVARQLMAGILINGGFSGEFDL